MSALPDELRDPIVLRAILVGVARAYEENLSRHDPGVGDDAITFGIHLWKSCAHFLADELAAVPAAKTDLVQQSLAIHLGRCRLRVHKLGDSEFDNPENCFPAHVGPAARMGISVKQLQLAFETGDEVELLDWVIGHYGSPEEGLRAIRLQAVGNERALDGSISSWEAVETVFDVSVGSSIRTQPAPADDVEIAPYPEIELHEPSEKDAQAEDE